MERNIRWYIPFKSYNGVSCRVNIYDNDWPSYIDPKQLTGTADPFYFEEDNSYDLLNDVLRYRTGYIGIVEKVASDDIANIYPSSTFDRYVEVLYGTTVIFNGYIQVQDFSNELVPMPRILKFPVISPLGLFEKRNFSSILPPTSKTLGELLDIVMVNNIYERVYLPQITGAGLDQQIFSLVVSPWNDNYHCSEQSRWTDKVMAGESYAYLVEGICKAFGWVCHDTPTALVFTSFDYNSNYIYYPVGHIGDSSYKVTDQTSLSAAVLTDYYSLADDKAQQNTILPDTGIEVKYEGNFGNEKFSFDRTYVARDPSDPGTDGVVTMPGFTVEDGERWSLCNLTPVPQLFEIQNVTPADFDTDGHVNRGSHCVAWNGHVGILVSVDGSWTVNQPLFKLRFYYRKRANRTWAVAFKGMKGPLGVMDDDDLVANGYVRFSKTINDDYVELSFYYYYGGTTWPQLPSYTLLYIYDIQFLFIEENEPYAGYRFKPTTENDILPSNFDNPPISSSVTMPFSPYRINDHMIGNTLRSTKITEYPYLFQPRQELVSKFRLVDEPVLPHTRLFSYLNKNWRMIARTFHVRDDEYTLTLQSSPVLTSN